LKAIEADDYDSLPAETFLKGFLRSYAQSIGLDPQEAMLVYEQSKVSEAPGEKDYSKKTSTPAKEKSSKSINVKLVTAGVAVAVCLIVLIYFVFISGDEGEPRKKNNTGGETGKIESTTALKIGESNDARNHNGGRLTEFSQPGGEGSSPAAKLTILPMRMAPQAGWNREKGSTTIEERDTTLQ
jgi:cytoskeletal protein RodZ